MNEKVVTKHWRCWDHHGDEAVYDADTAEAAARLYIEDGAWDRMTTTWHDVTVTEVDDSGDDIYEDDGGEDITVTLDAEEPPCEESSEHRWAQPDWTDDDVCRHCGMYRDEQRNVQRDDTGETMPYSTTYREPDDRSREWLDSLSDNVWAKSDIEYGSAANGSTYCGTTIGSGYDCEIKRVDGDHALVNLMTPQGDIDYLWCEQIDEDTDLQEMAIRIGSAGRAALDIDAVSPADDGWDDIAQQWDDIKVI